MEEVGKKPVEILIEQYSESHQNPINEVIHFICVPVIMWTFLGLFWSIHPWLAVAMTGLALAYYFTLSLSFFLGMLVMSAVMLGILYVLPATWILPLSVSVFVLAWIGQFIGHFIEGKKPSFFDDLRFLLIGPLFVLGFLYRKCHFSV
ncbi:putative membrane protein YGL010W [Oxalobacteraceae bacterium GrIS 2.11]